MKLLPRLCAAAMLAGQGAGALEPLEPYRVDAHTLHLWHLDETGAPFADSVSGGNPLQGLHNGAKAAQAGYPGLGHCVSFNHHAGGTPGESSLAGAILTLAPQLAIGRDDNAPGDFRVQGADGAFTYEALLKFDRLPEDAKSIALGIITMEGENDDRVFSFRIEREGFLSFAPLPNSQSSGGALASIPRTGPHAINTRDWFHVAVLYDGHEGVPESLQFFWTNLSAGVHRAHRIGAGMLDRDMQTPPGDFAIGNEARSFSEANAEAEPFPGLIDEVRISSVARDPTDFLFVPPSRRISPEMASPLASDGSRRGPFRLGFAGIVVDGRGYPVPLDPKAPLSLKPGLHRLDFDIGLSAGGPGLPVQLRCRLEGLEERWQTSVRGMSLDFQFLDKSGQPIGHAQFNVTGSSEGWGTGLSDSNLIPRREPIYAPPEAAGLRVTVSSGAPDTTGRFGIDDLRIHSPAVPEASLWSNGGFEDGVDFQSPTRTPAGWTRGGQEPAIAQVALRGDSAVLGLIDGDLSKSGEWTATQPIDRDQAAGRTLIAEWRECYNVIAGSQQRATYLKVPPGNYTFQVIGMTEEEQPHTASLAMDLVVRPHLWERPWFWPALTAAGMTLAAAAVVRHRNRRNRRRLRELAFQAALERDRTRIARDLHDDLGTRITVLNLTASLARQTMDRDPEKARRHLDKMADSARELVVAMDDLVWTVDPSHDNLDDLATQLTRQAEEIFSESPIRCRLDIPSTLPPLPIRSDFRHHILMAVREALNNILKHAGPCQATLRVRLEGKRLLIDIQDSGRGFDRGSGSAGDGHGLGNFVGRLDEIAGSCEIVSSPGGGTRVSFQCPLPDTSQASIP